MGSVEGFIKINRELPSSRSPKERINDFKEMYIPHSEELTKQQASRCMDCGVPFCHSGCPLGNFIPDFNDAVYHENWERATKLLLETNNFPEFTGRICPAPCEGSCVLGINKPAVAIEHIEKSIIEKAFDLGLITPSPPKNRKPQKVAIVGSGPAGLAAAAQLNQAGYNVTVFERDKAPGGLLMFGIPDFKLEKWVVERRINLMEAEGITFKVDCNVGKDISASQLRAEFDAIILTGGSTIPRDLPIPGRDLKGIHFAMDFLSQQNKRISSIHYNAEDILATGKHVLVIGGGDTGSDCIGTSNRQEAKSITQFELLSKPPNTRAINNPWPEWPLILRTSSSQEEGCEREWSIMTKEFLGAQGKVTGVKTVKVQWDQSKLIEIEDSEKIYSVDLVLLAMGFLSPQKSGLLEQLNVELDDRGNIKTSGYATSIPGVYAAGDIRRGQSLVVWAISEGREAARDVDLFLTKESKLPSKNISGYRV